MKTYLPLHVFADDVVQAEQNSRAVSLTGTQVLKEVDPRLYKLANVEEDPRDRSPEEVELAKTLRAPEKRALDSRIRGLFPRELRVPTDTPSRDGWNYDWKPAYPRV